MADAQQELMRRLAASLESSARVGEKVVGKMDELSTSVSRLQADVLVLRQAVDLLSIIVRGDSQRGGLQSGVATLEAKVSTSEKEAKRQRERNRLALKLAVGIAGSGGAIGAAHQLMTWLLQ